jgi:hypothetical protein
MYHHLSKVYHLFQLQLSRVLRWWTESSGGPHHVHTLYAILSLSAWAGMWLASNQCHWPWWQAVCLHTTTHQVVALSHCNVPLSFAGSKSTLPYDKWCVRDVSRSGPELTAGG